MKKILIMSMFLCGICFSLSAMDYKKVVFSGGAGAAIFAFAPALISPSLPKRLIKEAPEAYTGIILFGGVLGVAYGLVSPKSSNDNNPAMRMNAYSSVNKTAFRDKYIPCETLPHRKYKLFDTICE